MFSCMTVKPNTGVHSLRHRRRRLRHDEIAQRRDDELIVATERRAPCGWAAGGEVRQLLVESRAPFVERARPLGRFEDVRLSVPSTQPQMSRIGIDEQDGCNNLGVRCRIEPCLVAIGVTIGCALERGGRSDLKTQHGAHDLAVEVLAELGRRGPQVALHALAFGRAHLTDPAVLQHREGRQQHEQRARDEGRT